MVFGRLFWGLVMLFIGIILLGVNFGWWDSSVWNSVIDLWPLFLIVLGIGIVFGNNPIGIVFLLLLTTFAIAYVTNYRGVKDNLIGEERSAIVTHTSEQLGEGIKSAEVKLDLGAASVEIGSEEDTGKLFSASSSSGNDISTTVKNINDSAQIRISNEPKGSRQFFNVNSHKREFVINLTKAIPIDLQINSGASKLAMNLSTLKINSLRLDAGANTSEIRLGKEVEKVSVTISAGASKATIFVPSEYSLLIDSDSALLANNFEELGLSKEGRNWKSTDFENNTKQISIKISAGASTVNIEKY